MAAGIFISYRREDSQHAAGRLVDWLTQSFGRDRIFMDVDTIEPGLDFLDVINAKVAESFVFLVVIGPGWANAAGPDGRRRLDNPDDLVRLEVEAGLKRDIRVMPSPPWRWHLLSSPP
jgi:TIR domain